MVCRDKYFIEKACKLEPCTMLPHYFLSFTKVPLRESMLIKFGFLIEEALWKMKNNEEAICKVPLYMLVFTNFPCHIF